ncbi:MAG: M48 family metallopeptidase [Actinomycetes bacterium]
MSLASRPSRPTRTVERRAARGAIPPLELQRSTRRRRSASAYARDGVVVVQLPAGLPPAEEERLIARLVARVVGRERATDAGGDEALAARAARLADAYVDGVRPTSVTWSARMRRRWGSCTIDDRTIRISDRLASAPEHVLDYVLVHELCHLVHPDHSPAFHALLDRYPHVERARSFLDGVTWAEARLAPAGTEQPDEVEDVDGFDGRDRRA